MKIDHFQGNVHIINMKENLNSEAVAFMEQAFYALQNILLKSSKIFSREIPGKRYGFIFLNLPI